MFEGGQPAAEERKGLTVRIRPPRSRDLARIESLLESTGAPPLDREPHLADFVVALDESEVVGVAGLEVFGRAGLMRALAVAPAHRSRGLGRELFRSLLTRVNELGLNELYLRDGGAQAFLAKLGFELVPRNEVPFEIRESRGLRGGAQDDESMMRFSLDDTY